MEPMLDLVFESQRPRGQEKNLDIVVIPAIGVSKPSDWLDRSGASWLQNLTESDATCAAVWEYAYHTNLPDSVPKQLIKEGFSLLEALHSHCTKPQQKKVPVVFICHGTGGFVLKKALCLCRDQFYQYRPIIDVVSGFIFLGSPHFSEDIDAKKALDVLLKCRDGGIGRSLSSQQELSVLIEVCKSFELLNLQVPVVSAYETKETQTHQRLWSKLGRKSRGQMVVPKSLGTLKVQTEKSVDSKSNHIDICNVPIGADLYKACEGLIADVLDSAPQRIAENDRPYDVPGALKDDTLRSPSTAGWTRFEDVVSHQTSLPASSPFGGATGGSTIGSYEFVPAETALDVSTRDPKLPCFMLGDHCRRDNFVGREDILKTIDDHLLRPTSQRESTLEPNRDFDTALHLRSFAICGLGGIGKTELAIQYAHTRKQHFEAIFWLSADDSKILASNFANLAVQLGLEDDDSLDITASRDIVMGWLSKPLRKSSEPDERRNYVNWLLIFDNVDNLDVLADYWPKLGRGSVLITSRDPNAKQNIHIHHGLHLPPLTNTETEALMQQLTHVRVDQYQREALAKIAEGLDGLPLVVNQMSGLFRSFRLSYIDFLTFLQDEGIKKLYERQAGIMGAQKTQSLVTFWALDRLSAPTRALLQVICLLDPDDIPEDLLVDITCQVRLPDYPTSRGSYYAARGELLSSSLVNQMHNNKLSLHRLVQDAAKAMMGPAELALAFQGAARLVVSAWPFQSMKEHHSTARFSKCEELFPCVLRLKDGLKSMLESASDFPLDLSVARLFNDTGWYMFERGLQEETKPFCELSLQIAERMKSNVGAEAVECIRESHSFLGIALVETNEHSLSMNHKQKWLDMLLERPFKSGAVIEDYELGYAYNEIGVAYGNADRIEEAIDAFIRSIQIFQGLEDYEDIMLGWPEPNLGFMYWLKGDFDKAEQALVEILDIHASTWGVDDTNSFKTGKILYGLGNVLESQGRFDESLGFHIRCLEQYKKVLGMNHHRVGDVCHRIAGHYMRQGLYKDAREYLATALRIFRSRPYLANEFARTTFRKSKLLRLAGDHDEADQVMKQAYEARRSLRPGDTRPAEKINEEDYDVLVAFWSR